MAYDSRVYRILIASPGDVEEEWEIAVKVIQDWNDLHSYSRKVTLLPLRWETHTAPEYGTRPQEVINRAIVDDCDLLVGIFWTRLGSPTGVADSGTIEEIERVGKAGKPIMLYFSSREIDPDKINTDQIEKLKQFKEKTYPKGLVERYKKISEFSDKFSRQLEMKVGELQRSNASGERPLSLQFLSLEEDEFVGTGIAHTFEHHNVIDFDVAPVEDREKVKQFTAAAIKERSYLPVALAIENSSSSGIRNLYVELDLTATSPKLEVTESPSTGLFRRSRFVFPSVVSLHTWDSNVDRSYSEILGRVTKKVVQKLAKFDADKLQEVDGGWRLSFEWEAIQPQRTRIIKPVLFIYSPESAKLAIRAKVYADSFPEPLTLQANVSIEATQTYVKLAELLPDWESLIKGVEVEFTPTVSGQFIATDEPRRDSSQ